MYDVLKDLASYDAVCIPLSGYVTKPHKAAVMNHGVAYKFLRRYGLYLQFAFSYAIESNFKVHRVTSIDYKGHSVDLILFPEKPRFIRIRNEQDLQKLHPRYRHIYLKKINSKPLVPGYLCKASISLIEKSCKQLRKIANYYTCICLPLPGVESGGLEEDDVKSIISDSLHDVADRIYICTTEYKMLLKDWLDIKKSSTVMDVLNNKLEIEEFVRASELNVNVEQFVSTYFSDQGWSQIKYDVYPNKKKFVSKLAITISDKVYEAFRIRLVPVVISLKKSTDMKFKMVDTKGRTYFFKNKAKEIARSKKKLSLTIGNVIQIV